ncbi:MAG: DUF1592 domain-containing protein [Pseudomonadota bacterium]
MLRRIERTRWIERALAFFSACFLLGSVSLGQTPAPFDIDQQEFDQYWDFLDAHCSGCHNDYDLTADLSIYDLSGEDIRTGHNTEVWEKILRQVRTEEMPPHDKRQPSTDARLAFSHGLEMSLDAYAAANPDPGRATLRRLNRTEYANAVRDLLNLDVDVADQLPADNSGYGFDNIADVLTVSPTLMERYLVVAGRVARLATGLAPESPSVTTFQVPKDGSIKNSGRPAYNERSSDGLPLTSRGGGVFDYYAPHEGVYEISGYLNANTNNEVDRDAADKYGVRVSLSAGPHRIGMAFRRRLGPDETVERLSNTTDIVPLPTDPPMMLDLDVLVDGARAATLQVPSYRMSPRFAQTNFPRDVLQIDVAGPFEVMGTRTSPSREKIFICQPQSVTEEEPCAEDIIAMLARGAYRRAATDEDLARLMSIYHAERQVADFDYGIAAALQAMLVSPNFLFLDEKDPSDLAAGAIRLVDSQELASRLSLFLWSSIPDEELLNLAEKGDLADNAVLENQVLRMLDDPRSRALTDNFAGQWLHLRNLENHRPDIDVFPDFDVRLAQAMIRETEMFFGYVLATNQSIFDFIAADYTFLNERLAKHYGIDGVQGTALRKVDLNPEDKRGGILGHGSVLTVTSYANHTSVVRRGHWILENILGAPTPPPPPDVPALQEARIDGQVLTMRQQLERHRADPACSSCHAKIDPLGFALEGFNAVGGFRTADHGIPVDTSAVMSNGREFEGFQGLQEVLMERQDEFAHTFAEKLLTYALGRGLTAKDQPTVRQIVRNASEDDYRIHAFVQAIVQSDPFLSKRKPAT